MKHWYGIRLFPDNPASTTMVAYANREEAEARLAVSRFDYPAAYKNAVVVELTEAEAPAE